MYCNVLLGEVRYSQVSYGEVMSCIALFSGVKWGSVKQCNVMLIRVFHLFLSKLQSFSYRYEAYPSDTNHNSYQISCSYERASVFPSHDLQLYLGSYCSKFYKFFIHKTANNIGKVQPIITPLPYSSTSTSLNTQERTPIINPNEPVLRTNPNH